LCANGSTAGRKRLAGGWPARAARMMIRLNVQSTPGGTTPSAFEVGLALPPRSLLARWVRDGNGAVGYLLKDRVTALDEFLDAIERVAAGGTAMDPEVVRQLFARNNGDRGIAALTAREREVLGLIAQGHSNSAICAELVLAPASVEKHISNILAKLELPPADDSHRRVRAVLAYLNH
jgi:DNA-binding CsgD family transcriptional regulator